jgi:hypothetical protein
MPLATKQIADEIVKLIKTNKTYLNQYELKPNT